MTCQVVVEFKVKPDCVDKLRGWLREIIGDTRAFEGCATVDVIQDQDDPTHFLFVEQWGERAQYEKYFQWRLETGALEMLGSMLDGDPVVRYYDYFGV